MPNIRIVLATALSAFALTASAQSYPNKPIRFITPYPPGGTTEILARLLTAPMNIGQPFVIESRPGAGGNVGTDQVAKSAPDGYTILMGASGPLAINASLFKKLPYDPARDLTPIVLVASVPLILVVHPSLNVKTVGELVELLKAAPGKYSYASAGIGTPQHLSAQLFKTLAGVQMEHVPYSGSGPAITSLVGGQVPIAFESMIAVLPHVQGGRLRALAVTSSRRNATVPDIPTVAESGVKGYESIAWYGVAGPAGMPKDVVTKLNAEMRKALDTTEVKARLFTMGSGSVHGTPEQFGAFIKSEIGKWAKVVRESGATVDN
jgi:tripartite-type tricarboxylate transporter receptor subunit TctC